MLHILVQFFRVHADVIWGVGALLWRGVCILIVTLLWTFKVCGLPDVVVFCEAQVLTENCAGISLFIGLLFLLLECCCHLPFFLPSFCRLLEFIRKLGGDDRFQEGRAKATLPPSAIGNIIQDTLNPQTLGIGVSWRCGQWSGCLRWVTDNGVCSISKDRICVNVVDLHGNEAIQSTYCWHGVQIPSECSLCNFKFILVAFLGANRSRNSVLNFGPSHLLFITSSTRMNCLFISLVSGKVMWLKMTLAQCFSRPNLSHTFRKAHISRHKDKGTV